ncbi:ELWxxDGT repeat protein [Pyxidicoccus sp. MSG2]|uniref:ELWxxDGT repeat protein n=1 Tax=Pyxidicoccus sp. MSG2 TaxID=2996790 RepID=UPI002271A817|nr:ELWxxDGT repeat protein [Pyxidicoccus sp. MSG2]MCY1017757.1 HYR domain-containing protein [Pyxidicoccus sp. MSG2]
MEHLGNLRQPLLWLAVTLAVVGGCTESVAPKPDGPRGTSSAALEVTGPELVADLRSGYWSTRPGSAPSGFMDLGGTALFAATEASSGRELWTSDGTEAGTQLLKDLRPGAESSAPSDFVVMGGVIYFTADDGSSGRELWRTDGTASGTVLVKDIAFGSDSSSPSSLKVVNGILYFSATDGVLGPELWRSDGTDPGTRLVKDIVSGANGSSPQHLTAAGNLLFFSATTPNNGRELWRSDGTFNGTFLVRDLGSGSQDGFISELVAVGTRVFFVGLELSTFRALWTSDGTSGGTRLVHSTRPNIPSESDRIQSLTAMNGRLYFASIGTSGGASVGSELWTSDGSTTSLVKDIAPGTGGSSPRELVAVGSTLYFSANDGSTGVELWKSDGTAAGTQRVADIAPGAMGSGPQKLTDIHGVLYFSANDGSTGRELWRSEDIPFGTQRVMDINFGPEDSNPEGMTAVGTRVFFATDGLGWGVEPWWTDGRDYMPTRDIYTEMGHSDPRALTALGDRLYFTADADELGREPWVTDASGTWILQDIYTGAFSSNPTRFVPMNGALVFDANDGLTGQELWTSNGTPAGTRLLKDLQPGALSSSPRDLKVLPQLGSRLLFTANDGQTGFEPWISDGTASGTQLLKDVWAGSAGGSLSGGFVEFQGRGYFGASDGTSTTLWQTPGTAAGTVSLQNVVPYFDRAVAVTPGFFYFAGSLGTSNDVELWRSDGTRIWTNRVKDINPSGSSSPADFALMDDLLYFSAAPTATVRGLWRSNGTEAGTQEVVNYAAGTRGFNPRYLSVANRVLFFQAQVPNLGIELWRSDGTLPGTRPVKDVNPGPTGSMADEPMLVLEPEGLVVFAASDGVTGMEPWISDGTETGTLPLGDLAPGALSSNPRLFTRKGKDIYFVANDGTTGFELWRMTLDIPPDTTPPTVTCPSSVTVEVQSKTGATVSYPAATVTDNAPGRPALVYSKASGTVFPLGTTSVTATATDAAGNKGACSFTVTVQDTIAPALTCPADVTAEATDSTGAIVSYPSAKVTDTGSAPEVTYSQASGTLFSVGTTAVTVTATDTSGNSTTCSFNVTVRDTTQPAVTCPASITAEATRSSGGLVSYPPATASDTASPPVTLSYSQDSGTVFPIGETLVTATATDAAGNSATCTFSVTVHDTTAPVLVCPTDVITEAADASGTVVSYPPATVSDSVTASPELTYSQASGTVFALGTTGVTVTARDAAGNTSSCAFSVTVRDTTAPSLSCPTDLVTEATGAAGAAVPYSPATASDAVTASPALTYSHASGTTFPMGMTSVTVTATDTAGNSATCTFGVTVRDTTAPSVSCPADVIAEAVSASGATVSYAPATASDAVTSSPALTYSQANGTLFSLGMTRVTVIAEDAAGNTASCAFNVSVRDETAPVVTCPIGVPSEATGAAGSVVSYAPATAADAVTASPVLTYSQASGTVFPLGVTTVTVTATDAAGNAASCEFDVLVQDTTAPTLSCPADVTAEATNASGATVSYPPATASDAVTGSPQVAYGQASGTLFPVGTTAVTVTARDAAGNSVSCSFNVSVRDATKPEVSCPASVTVEATSASGATVSYPPATASDTASPPVTVGYSHESGTVFPLGVTTVTVTATDAAGNAASCTFEVTVQDTTAPSLSCPADVLTEATSTSGATVSYASMHASDAVTASPALSYSRASGVLFALGTTHVTVTATDAAGNAASCSFDVTVQDTTAPALVCPTGTTAEATSASGATLEYAPATASDATTSAPELVYSQASGTVFPLGATDVAVTARDASGNEATCHFTLTVRDTTPPSVGCTADLTVEAEGADGTPVAFELASPLDTVTRAPQVSTSHAPGSRFPLGTTAVTVTARDEADNAASCTFSITVRDTTAPVLSCPADMTVKSQDDAGAPVTFTASASDAVTSSPELTYSHAPGSTFPRGTTPVTVTARDEAGQTAGCTFQVTVRRPASVPVPAEPVGFGCEAGSSGGRGAGLWLLLLVSAGWLQRRSRSLVR